MRHALNALGGALLAALAVSCSDPAAKPPVVNVSPPISGPAASADAPPAETSAIKTTGEDLDGGPDAPGDADGASASAPRAPAGPSPDAIAACKNECDKESDRCDQGCPRTEAGRGCLRRCGCARISCFSGCESSGEAEFRCR